MALFDTVTCLDCQDITSVKVHSGNVPSIKINCFNNLLSMTLQFCGDLERQTFLQHLNKAIENMQMSGEACDVSQSDVSSSMITTESKVQSKSKLKTMSQNITASIDDNSSLNDLDDDIDIEDDIAQDMDGRENEFDSPIYY